MTSTAPHPPVDLDALAPLLGEGFRASHADRLALADGSRGWVVLEGRVELFARAGGWSRHLMTLEPGQMALGLDGDLGADGGAGLVLEGVPTEARLAALDGRTLARAVSGGGAPEATALLTTWLARLHGVLGRARPGEGGHALEVGQGLVLGEGEWVLARQPVWVTSSGSALPWPLDELPCPEGAPLLITPDFWAMAREAGDIVARGMDDPELDLEAALAADGLLVAGLLSAWAARDRETERARIQDRYLEGRAALVRGTGRLVAAAGGPVSAEALADGDGVLLSAVRQVGAVQGLSFPEPRGGWASLGAARDPLALLADGAGCEYRTVQLEGRWWRDGAMPLLIFRDEDLSPRAALPNTRGGLDLVDPHTGRRQPLTEPLAGEFFGSAILFYPTLGEAPSTLGRLVGLGRRGIGRDVWTVLVMMALIGLCSTVTPMVVGQITGTVVQQAQVGQLALLVAALVLTSVASVSFTYVQSLAALRVEGRLDTGAQAALWTRLLRLPAGFFRRYSVGDLAKRALGVDNMRQLVSTSALSSLMSATVGLFSLALMVYYDWLLALCATALFLLYGLFVYWLARRSARMQREMLDQSGRSNSLLLQFLASVSKLRVSGAEGRAFDRWAEAYATERRITFRRGKLALTLPVVNALVTFGGLLLFVVVLASQAGQFWGPDLDTFSWKAIDDATLDAVIAPEDFLAFFTAYGQVLSAAFGLTQVILKLVEIAPLRDRLDPIIQEPVESAGHGEDPGELDGGIELAEVNFRYAPDLPLVLSDFSLSIAPGGHVAIVGPSGAGKSSLIRLLLGFDRPEAGSIFLGGKDLARLDKRAVRRNFGVVLQSGRLMAGSIFDNIVAGSALDEEAAWRAARMAGLDKDIDAMPMKMQTVVAEGAPTISGGQRQRLMIARAIAREPRVLIFDEATSALDNETQAIVSDSLAALRCTRVTIAHRLSTVIDADLIVVMDRGRLVEQGTYAELMALDGLFADLARRQVA